jgi:F420-dependent oxidoreductase-like protein
MPFEKPLARTREYVKIVRDIVARKDKVTNDGPHYPLPYPGGTGLGKPLRSTIHPVREDIPIFLGAEGPKNVALAAEVCDGWMALFFSPRNQDFYRDALGEGFARDGARRSWDDFEVMATVPVIIHDDVEQAADFLRPMYALYFGGMGARGRNFHHDVAVRLGYEAEAKRVQDLYLDGKKQEAVAAVPDELVDEISLIGPKERIADRLDAWRESGITTMIVGAQQPEALQVMAELVL